VRGGSQADQRGHGHEDEVRSHCFILVQIGADG
jgi:hypothetical protein